ncbi:hypothetical protein D3C72_2247980 [compost metagenome]
MAAAQGVGQGLFVDQAAACGIDQEGAGFHQAQLVFADQVVGGVIEWAMQAQGIDLR